MTTANQRPYDPEDEVDLRELFLAIWRGKWFIMALTLVFAIGGVAYALYLPDVYTAEAKVAPEDGQGGQMGGQLGNLASLAGVNVGSGGSGKTIIAREILQSRAFLTDFIRRRNLAVPLAATQGWNVKKQEWRINTEVYNPQDESWRANEEGQSAEPTDWQLYKALSGKLSVSQDEETGILTLSVSSQSPRAAQQWAEWLLADINEHMREKDVREARNRIDYLRQKLEETNITGMQQVFYQLIEGETRTVMLANANDEYVFETIDPAVEPEQASEPKRALICIVATLTGGLLGTLIVFVREFLKPKSS